MSELSELLNRANDANPMATRARSDRIGKRLHFATLSNYQRGKHPVSPDAETLALLAEAYNLSLRQVQEAAGVQVGDGQWDVPVEANQLTRRQQRALTELIRAMVEGVGRDAAGSTTPIDVGDVLERTSPVVDKYDNNPVTAARGDTTDTETKQATRGRQGPKTGPRRKTSDT